MTDRIANRIIVEQKLYGCNICTVNSALLAPISEKLLIWMLTFIHSMCCDSRGIDDMGVILVHCHGFHKSKKMTTKQLKERAELEINAAIGAGKLTIEEGHNIRAVVAADMAHDKAKKAQKVRNN